MSHVATPADIDAQLAAMMQKEEESSNTRGTLTKIKTAGTYRIRILPNGDQTDIKWWAKWGLHFWKKGLVGNQNVIVFTSATHTWESDHDPIALAVRKAENSGDPALEALAGELYAGAQFACNAMVLGPVGSTEQVGDVVQLAFNKTLRDNLFSFARMVSNRFFMLEENIVLHIRYNPHKSGRGLVGDIVGREAPVNISGHVDMSKLKSMKEVVEDQISNAKHPNLFTGNLFQPLAEAPAAGTLAAPAGMAAPALAPPAAVGPAPLAPPMAAPATAAPAAAPAPVAAPSAAPAATPVEIAMGQPAAAPAEVVSPAVYSTGTPAAPAAPAAAPVIDVSPAPAAAPAEVAPAAAAPDAISDDELARQLMSMVN